MRVQVTVATCGDTVEALIGRLQARVAEAAGRWAPRAWPDPVDPCGVLAQDSVVTPRGGGWIVRVKPYALIWCEVAAAVRMMDLMDYRAHLDPDAQTDVLVYQAGPTGYRLRRLHSAAPPRPSAVPLALDPRPAPVLNRDQAVDRLDRTGLARLFFQDAASCRASVLYRRFDGCYRLIAGAV